MAKILKITFPEKCIGCELCVYEVQRQLKKIGFEGSPIRVFRNREENIFGDLTYIIEMTSEVNDLNLNKIVNICPTGVFTVEDEENEGTLLE